MGWLGGPASRGAAALAAGQPLSKSSCLEPAFYLNLKKSVVFPVGARVALPEPSCV